MREDSPPKIFALFTTHSTTEPEIWALKFWNSLLAFSNSLSFKNLSSIVFLSLKWIEKYKIQRGLHNYKRRIHFKKKLPWAFDRNRILLKNCGNEMFSVPDVKSWMQWVWEWEKGRERIPSRIYFFCCSILVERNRDSIIR